MFSIFFEDRVLIYCVICQNRSVLSVGVWWVAWAVLICSNLLHQRPIMFPYSNTPWITLLMEMISGFIFLILG